MQKIKERYKQDLCINCNGKISMIQYDGYGEEQPYCDNCNIYYPNNEEAVMKKLFHILKEKIEDEFSKKDFILKWLSKNGIDIVYMDAMYGTTLDYLESVYETYKNKPDQLKYWKNGRI